MHVVFFQPKKKYKNYHHLKKKDLFCYPCHKNGSDKSNFYLKTLFIRIIGFYFFLYKKETLADLRYFSCIKNNKIKKIKLPWEKILNGKFSIEIKINYCFEYCYSQINSKLINNFHN